MNPTASSGTPGNPVFWVPPNTNYPVVPGVVSQVPLYPSAQPQVHLIPGNPLGLPVHVTDPQAHRALKEGKVLGALQILIGLVHIAFGSALVTVINGRYTAISFYGGFPFWGGICFIISGALSVCAEKNPGSSCLLNGSTGMNIVSAIFAVVGIMLFITDLSISITWDWSYDPYYNYSWGVSPGVAISCALLIFCLLEFCIACTSSHFGCQLSCYQYNNVSVVLPNVYAANPVVIPGPENVPERYPAEAHVSK
ncbi:PREDICTED: membrane-spanning 4-domains subfamily A member 8 [Elephantulus edwardii]|uniref:membrane-spanning 4-domains subfamily A member 8 n=1 Tax=Elephantulus edwardii TaxID=28737 RepID=UPI0003F0B6C1|nr:PREDICTED: membrane-spanning 4-domains subfamily A member 8 [Elephantulus edwardii]